METAIFFLAIAVIALAGLLFETRGHLVKLQKSQIIFNNHVLELGKQLRR